MGLQLTLFHVEKVRERNGDKVSALDMLNNCLHSAVNKIAANCGGAATHQVEKGLGAYHAKTMKAKKSGEDWSCITMQVQECASTFPSG